MSGVLNEFDAAQVRYSVEEKTAYIIGPLINNSVFRYTILCRRAFTETTANIFMFFNMQTWQCLVVTTPGPTAKYRCYLLRFWLKEELPELSVNIFEKQELVMKTIGEQFKEQYASLILDGIINS